MTRTPKPKIIIAVRLYSFVGSPRNAPIGISKRPYGCPLFVKNNTLSIGKDHGFDCRIYPIMPSAQTVLDEEVWGLYEVRFLDPEKAASAFNTGTEFLLWESGEIGEGIIVSRVDK